MIRTIRIRTVGAAVTLAIFALAFVPAGAAAAAQPALPALRAHVTVDSNLVRVGDLVANAGPVADIPIFRAPDIGTTGTVPTGQVIAAIRPYQLIDIDTGGIAQVTVTRAGRIITPREISARIARALARQYDLGKAHDLALTFDRPAHALAVAPSATGPLQVAALNYDPRTHRFAATLDLPSSAMLHQRPPRFVGTAIAIVDAIAVAHAVQRGDVLQTADLTVLRQPRGPAEVISKAKAVIGLAARHELRPGRPLRAADLMKPELVRRDQTVTVVYEAPGLTLTLRGKAQQAGALGDTIEVINPQTKRVLEGVITGRGRVSVGTGGPLHLADGATPAATPFIVEPAPQDE